MATYKQKDSGSEQKEIYLFQRDDEERLRLTKQHEILSRLTGDAILEPHIPTSNLLRIADIGTGTGVWLQDLANALSQSSSADREYVGFDISAQHFPDSPPSRIQFKIHNILEPFPAELHGQFDLVHIRLLVLALAKDQFKTAVQSALELLKPGGFIQWEEFENANHKWPSNEVANLVRGIFENVATQSGISKTPCADVAQVFVELGCEDVKIVDYDTMGREGFDQDVKEWARAAMKATLYPALLRDGEGRSEEETRKLADDIYERCEKSGDAAVLNIPLMRVVGRKRID